MTKNKKLKNMASSYDKMRGIISEMPKYFEIGEKLEIKNKPKPAKRFENIIICGMGGSALGGLILKSVWNKVPVIVHRDYGLPKEAGKNSLIACNSYSGGTEETLSAYSEAVKRGLKVYSISIGGKLAELCEKNKTPWLELPIKDIPPRTSAFLQIAAILKILDAEKLDGKKFAGEFKKAAKKIDEKAVKKSAENLAAKMRGKIPLIYASDHLSVLGYHLKISLNENAKIHAFFNVIPECAHNEIVGFSKNSRNAADFFALFPADGKEHPRNAKKIKIFSEIIKKQKFPAEILKLSGNQFEKIVKGALFNNWLSFHLAKFYEEDIIAIDLIDELKKRMALG